MQNLFTSDLHLGHKTISKYRDCFTSMEEHDNYIIDKILKLDKRVVLTVVGDFIFDGEHYKKYIHRLSKKKCRIKLVMGNHDSKLLYSENIFEIQLPTYSYHNMWVSHVPIHPEELRGRFGNIHGHLHKDKLRDNRYYNVNLDVNDYEFVLYDDIKEHFDDIYGGSHGRS